MPGLPLLVSIDVAAVSSECAELCHRLNDKRVQICSQKTNREENHWSIRQIEVMLDRLNNNQGMGFLLAGRILDTETLIMAAKLLVTAAATLIPLILALRPGSHDRKDQY